MENRKYLSFKDVALSFESTFDGFTSFWCNDEYILSSRKLTFDVPAAITTSQPQPPSGATKSGPKSHLFFRFIFVLTIASFWLWFFGCATAPFFVPFKFRVNFPFGLRSFGILKPCFVSGYTIYEEKNLSMIYRWFMFQSFRRTTKKKKLATSPSAVSGWMCEISQKPQSIEMQSRPLSLLTLIPEQIAIRNVRDLWLFGIYSLRLFWTRDLLFWLLIQISVCRVSVPWAPCRFAQYVSRRLIRHNRIVITKTHVRERKRADRDIACGAIEASFCLQFQCPQFVFLIAATARRFVRSLKWH